MNHRYTITVTTMGHDLVVCKLRRDRQPAEFWVPRIDREVYVMPAVPGTGEDQALRGYLRLMMDACADELGDVEPTVRRLPVRGA